MTAASYNFRWQDLGDIEAGRPNMGNFLSVSVYRLMQYTLRDTLNRNLGAEKASALFREAGFEAGCEFCHNLLDKSLPFNDFVAHLQDLLRELKIGILRIEKSDPLTGELIMTVSEDLDCSGLPVSGSVVCEYDEGFLAGILEAYKGIAFQVEEIDCWASGDRTCRFRATPIANGQAT